MRVTRRISGVGVFACALALTVLPARAADDHDYEVTDSSAVYLGSGKHPKTPAVISVDRVWAEIPEYKTIVEEGLTDEDPRYHLLMRKATKRFEDALVKEAKRESYDLIAEVGAVKALKKGKKVPSATAGMIELVSRD